MSRVVTIPNIEDKSVMTLTRTPGGGGYCHIWAIEVCAAVKGMVFKQFTLG